MLMKPVKDPEELSLLLAEVQMLREDVERRAPSSGPNGASPPRRLAPAR